MAKGQRIFICSSLFYILVGQVVDIYLNYKSTGDVVAVTESLAWVLIGKICVVVCWTIHTRTEPITEIINKLAEIYPQEDSLLEELNVISIIRPLQRIMGVFQTSYMITMIFKLILPVVQSVFVYFIVNETQKEFSLVFPLGVWYPFDPYRSVLLTAAVYIFEAWGAFLSTTPMLVVTALIGGITSNLCVQFKLLTADMANFKPRQYQNDSALHAIKLFVLRHYQLIRLTDDVKNIFSSFLLGNYCACSIGMSLCMFVATTSDNWDVVIEYVCCVFCFIFYITTLSFFGQRYMEEVIQVQLCEDVLNPNYNLVLQSLCISGAIYNGYWLDAEPRVRKYLYLIKLRSSKPAYLSGRGFFVVSLQSCAKILTTTYSYFTVLRTAYKHS